MKKSQFVFEDDDLEKKLAAMGVKPKAGSSRTPYDVAMDELYGDEEEKPKNKNKNKKPKAGSNRVPKSMSGTTGTSTTTKSKAGSSRSLTVGPDDRIRGGAGRTAPSFVNPNTDPSLEKPKAGAGRTAPSFVNPNNADAPTRLVNISPGDRIGGAPAGSKPTAAIDSSKLTGKRTTNLAKIGKVILSPLAVVSASNWLGPALLAGQGAKFVADWHAYNTGAARVADRGEYTAPCLDPNYDPYDDPFVDLYGDDKGKVYQLNYYGSGFMNILNTFGVEPFTPRMSNIIYGIIPTLLTSMASSMIIFRTIAVTATIAGATTGIGVLIGSLVALGSIAVGWILSMAINKMLKKVDQWGPSAADAVAQFIMEQLTTSGNLKTLCSFDLSEAAQDDEYQDRDEEPISGGAVDTFAIMKIAATIKEVYKEIDQELQAEGDQEKLAEWRRTLKQAKEMAKEQIKG